jgi:hypothetical protein
MVVGDCSGALMKLYDLEYFKRPALSEDEYLVDRFYGSGTFKRFLMNEGAIICEKEKKIEILA